MPVIDDEYLDEVRARPASPHEMTNFDHSIDDGMEADLRAGMRSCHNAWNFNGTVWYDAAEGMFFEAVYRYHAIAAIISNPDLAVLMDEVNDQHGWD